MKNKIWILAIVLALVFLAANVLQAQFVLDRQAIKKGDGMGLAHSAELNGYPGPKHVLELESELALSPEQKEKVQKIYENMRASAIDKGKVLIASEDKLDKLFRSGKAEARDIYRQIQKVSLLWGELRYVHLKAHFKCRDLLTREQIQKYMEIRHPEAAIRIKGL